MFKISRSFYVESISQLRKSVLNEMMAAIMMCGWRVTFTTTERGYALYRGFPIFN